jgi:aspartate ammonia-lyase
MQPGSSIMPGKVNPVMPEVMNEVCFKVIGNDATVTMASQDGLLQLKCL